MSADMPIESWVIRVSSACLLVHEHVIARTRHNQHVHEPGNRKQGARINVAYALAIHQSGCLSMRTTTRL